MKKACRICLEKVCSRCCVKDLNFCTRCLYTVNQTSALQIAVDEVPEDEGDGRIHKRRGSQASDHTGASSNWNSRPSASSPRSDGSVSLLETESYKSNHMFYIGGVIPSLVKSTSDISGASLAAMRTMSLLNVACP